MTDVTTTLGQGAKAFRGKRAMVFENNKEGSTTHRLAQIANGACLLAGGSVAASQLSALIAHHVFSVKCWQCTTIQSPTRQ